MQESPVPKIVLKPRHALPFFNRHPWVFAGAIARTEGDPDPGDEVDVHAHTGEFIARGLYNPRSNIAVRLFRWDEPQELDHTFWSDRIDTAVSLRQKLFGTDLRSVACRLIYSEGDGLSGLIVDQYAGWLVVQFTSFAVAQRRTTIVELLRERLQPRGIWLRTEKGIRKTEGLDIADGLLEGEAPPRPLFVTEQGIQYGVDLAEGQKTGFYLDQRVNRVAAAQYVSGARVLDVFCYTGGFSIAAATVGKAKSVLGIDSSENALLMAQGNAELNGVADRCRFERSDASEAMDRLHRAGERFNAVILDPPKLARSRSGVLRAMKAYQRLNRKAIELLHPNGILVTCSCSGHVTRQRFGEMLSYVASDTKRSIQVLETRSAAPDHPISIHCPESGYLKCCICRVA